VKIARVDLVDCVMPKEDPKWAFALAANPTSEGLIVSLTTEDGRIGHGYASATAHMGASREGLRAILGRFEPLLVGQDPFRIEAILLTLDRNLHGNEQAKAA
jgi:L-alanine-DL-glutamate epimerase-like enolase superfamily enzyme